MNHDNGIADLFSDDLISDILINLPIDRYKIPHAKIYLKSGNGDSFESLGSDYFIDLTFISIHFMPRLHILNTSGCKILLQYSSLTLLERECYEVEVQSYRKTDYKPMIYVHPSQSTTSNNS